MHPYTNGFVGIDLEKCKSIISPRTPCFHETYHACESPLVLTCTLSRMCVYSHIVFCIGVYNFHMCMCMLICTCAFTYICAGTDICTSIFDVAPHVSMHSIHHAPCMLHALCNRHDALCRIRTHMHTHTYHRARDPASVCVYVPVAIQSSPTKICVAFTHACT